MPDDADGYILAHAMVTGNVRAVANSGYTKPNRV